MIHQTFLKITVPLMVRSYHSLKRKFQTIMETLYKTFVTQNATPSLFPMQHHNSPENVTNGFFFLLLHHRHMD